MPLASSHLSPSISYQEDRFHMIAAFTGHTSKVPARLKFSERSGWHSVPRPQCGICWDESGGRKGWSVNGPPPIGCRVRLRLQDDGGHDRGISRFSSLPCLSPTSPRPMTQRRRKPTPDISSPVAWTRDCMQEFLFHAGEHLPSPGSYRQSLRHSRVTAPTTCCSLRGNLNKHRGSDIKPRTAMSTPVQQLPCSAHLREVDRVARRNCVLTAPASSAPVSLLVGLFARRPRQDPLPDNIRPCGTLWTDGFGSVSPSKPQESFIRTDQSCKIDDRRDPAPLANTAGRPWTPSCEKKHGGLPCFPDTRQDPNTLMGCRKVQPPGTLDAASCHLSGLPNRNRYAVVGSYD
ncbi:hypothetical protein Bbelb_356390 [Branchiostoma belcheri]|nr:hypothetical protein Bbelb_356390 [Branchiostoma belcheri]